MKLDRYIIIARLVPAIISTIPIVVFNYFFLNTELSKFLNSLILVTFINGVTMPLIFIFLLAHVNRYIAKSVFENHYFKDELRFPTTDYLFYSSKDSTREFREKIYKKVQKDFQILIPAKKGNLEENEIRRIISEVVGLIRKKVGKGKLLHQHNTEYGFFRNLIGGSLISFFLSIFNVLFFSYFFPNSLAVKVSIFTTVLYLTPLLLSKKILNDHGRWYAKTLMQEYLTLN